MQLELNDHETGVLIQVLDGSIAPVIHLLGKIHAAQVAEAQLKSKKSESEQEQKTDSLDQHKGES